MKDSSCGNQLIIKIRAMRIGHQVPQCNLNSIQIWCSTLIPLQTGQTLTWDVTVATMFADSYIQASASSAGAAAEMAASRKLSKYASVSGAYLVQPIALETLGPIMTVTHPSNGRNDHK